MKLSISLALNNFILHCILDVLFCFFSNTDDESWNLVTCFCGRPFAGRPMIECSRCYVWIHLYCAKIKKDKVPDVFVCQKCKDKAVRRSKRKKH